MAKLTTLLIIIALLFSSSSSLIFAARPTPVSLPQSKESEHVAVEENESCQGLNEEECLIRRTLVAHTDYIYTQHHNRP